MKPFGFKKAEHSPGFLLWQTTMVWQRHIKQALLPYDISHPQFVILATLLWFESHDFDTTQVSIINWTKLDKMTVSKSLKKLSCEGYVTRIEHAADTRAKSVSLTKKGQNMVGILVPLVESIDEIFFKILKKTEHDDLVKIMAKLAKSEK